MYTAEYDCIRLSTVGPVGCGDLSENLSGYDELSVNLIGLKTPHLLLVKKFIHTQTYQFYSESGACWVRYVLSQKKVNGKIHVFGENSFK